LASALVQAVIKAQKQAQVAKDGDDWYRQAESGSFPSVAISFIARKNHRFNR
jgi:hypothetical protein